jgi:gentisate 1,2-dioxygenase
VVSDAVPTGARGGATVVIVVAFGQTAAMEPALAVGEAVEDWAGDARYFEYTRAANPIGSGRVPRIPLERFPADRHARLRTGVVPFDLAGALRTVSGPATSPALLASFVRIAAGDELVTDPVASSELYHVLAGAGSSRWADGELHWGEGDFVVLPAGGPTTHRATEDALLYWVHDEPLLRYLGVRPAEARFAATRFPAADVHAELERIVSSPHATDRNRLAVLLNTTPNDLTQTVTHLLWAMYGLLPADAVQRPHRHQSVALDLVVECQPGCYTLVGRSIDDRGDIVDPVRIDWERHGAFVTPPGLWHAHINESGAPAVFVPVQDAGLHTHLRSLDIRFAPSPR